MASLLRGQYLHAPRPARITPDGGGGRDLLQQAQELLARQGASRRVKLLRGRKQCPEDFPRSRVVGLFARRRVEAELLREAPQPAREPRRGRRLRHPVPRGEEALQERSALPGEPLLPGPARLLALLVLEHLGRVVGPLIDRPQVRLAAARLAQHPQQALRPQRDPRVASVLGPVRPQEAAAQQGGDPGEGPVVLRQPQRPQQGGDDRRAPHRPLAVNAARDVVLGEDFLEEVGGSVEVAGGDNDRARVGPARQQFADRPRHHARLAQRAGGFEDAHARGVIGAGARCGAEQLPLQMEQSIWPAGLRHGNPFDVRPRREGFEQGPSRPRALEQLARLRPVARQAHPHFVAALGQGAQYGELARGEAVEPVEERGADRVERRAFPRGDQAGGAPEPFLGVGAAGRSGAAPVIPQDGGARRDPGAAGPGVEGFGGAGQVLRADAGLLQLLDGAGRGVEEAARLGDAVVIGKLPAVPQFPGRVVQQ